MAADDDNAVAERTVERRTTTEATGDGNTPARRQMATNDATRQQMTTRGTE